MSTIFNTFYVGFHCRITVVRFLVFSLWFRLLLKQSFKMADSEKSSQVSWGMKKVGEKHEEPRRESEIFLADLPTSWRIEAQAFDVDNSGSITADELLVMLQAHTDEKASHAKARKKNSSGLLC